MKKSQKKQKMNPSKQPKFDTKADILREKVIIGFASMIEVLFLLLELYFIIHAYGNFQIMIVIAICMAGILFFMVMAILDLNQKVKSQERVEFEEIYKAQKATYIATKKYFDEIGQRISALEANTNFPAEDIISAQKAVAKVTISRNKENAEALMNANDELIQRVFGFEEKLSDNNEEMLRQQKELMEQTMGENNKNIQQQFDALQDMLVELQNDMNALERTPVVVAPAEAAATPVQEPVVEETVEPEIPVAEEVAEPEISVAEEVVEPEVSAEEEVAEVEMPAMEESVVDTEDDLPDIGALDEEEELPNLDELPSLDDEADDLPDLDDLPSLDDFEEVAEETASVAEEEVIEDEPAEEKVAEPEVAPMPEVSDDPNKQLSADEIAALFANADSVAEPELEVAPMPELSDDPNKQLSADEIAALFANADSVAAPVEEEAVPEVEEIPEPAVEEEKPPMPDLSGDPNKTLSPEEIAALFANA